VVDMSILTLNKHRSKLKGWCFKYPTYYIAIRWQQGKELSNNSPRTKNIKQEKSNDKK